MERTSTPVTVYLKQKKIRHLVPGELCSPKERRKGLGLYFFLPIGVTRMQERRQTTHGIQNRGCPRPGRGLRCCSQGDGTP